MVEYFNDFFTANVLLNVRQLTKFLKSVNIQSYSV